MFASFVVNSRRLKVFISIQAPVCLFKGLQVYMPRVCSTRQYHAGNTVLAVTDLQARTAITSEYICRNAMFEYFYKKCRFLSYTQIKINQDAEKSQKVEKTLLIRIMLQILGHNYNFVCLNYGCIIKN